MWQTSAAGAVLGDESEIAKEMGLSLTEYQELLGKVRGTQLKEIAAVLGVTESRVCQLHSQSIARLRTRLRDW